MCNSTYYNASLDLRFREKPNFENRVIVIMEVDIVHYCLMLNETSAELLRMMVMMKAGR